MPIDSWLQGVWPPADDAAPSVAALRVRQVAALSRQVPMVAAPSVIGAWLTVWVFHEAAPAALLVPWAALLTLAALPPMLSWRRNRGRSLPSYVPRRVLLRSIAGTLVIGVLWGGEAALLFPYGGPEHRTFLTFMVGGMSGGAVASLAVQPGICLAFIVPALIPITLRFAASGVPLGGAQAVMGLLYLGALTVFVRNGYQAFLTTVTLGLERDSLRGELEGAEARLSGAIEALRDGFALHDAADRLVLSNRKYRHLFGSLPGFGAPGRAFADDLRQAEAAGLLAVADAAVLAARQGRSQAISAHELRLADGRWLLLAESRTATGDTASLFTDITELKQRESALEDSRKAEAGARQEAEEASRAKSQFLANMSHELRTPLNAIIGFSQVASGDTGDRLSPATYRDFARDVLDSARHLLGVINDILDFSKLEAGQMRLEEATVSAAEEIGFAQRLLASRAAEGEVRVTPVGLEALPPIRGDARALRQAALNLLSNAIKFNPPGGSVAVRGSRTADGGIAIAFADTGIGMKAEDIPKALTPFTQLDSGLSRRYEGTGLGLPLAKSMIELHGGRLEIASVPGIGTTATMILPRERVA